MEDEWALGWSANYFEVDGREMQWDEQTTAKKKV